MATLRYLAAAAAMDATAVGGSCRTCARHPRSTAPAANVRVCRSRSVGPTKDCLGRGEGGGGEGGDGEEGEGRHAPLASPAEAAGGPSRRGRASSILASLCSLPITALGAKMAAWRCADRGAGICAYAQTCPFLGSPHLPHLRGTPGAPRPLRMSECVAPGVTPGTPGALGPRRTARAPCTQPLLPPPLPPAAMSSSARPSTSTVMHIEQRQSHWKVQRIRPCSGDGNGSSSRLAHEPSCSAGSTLTLGDAASVAGVTSKSLASTSMALWADVRMGAVPVLPPPSEGSAVLTPPPHAGHRAAPYGVSAGTHTSSPHVQSRATTRTPLYCRRA